LKQQIENVIYSNYVEKRIEDQLVRYGSDYGGWHVCACGFHSRSDTLIISAGVGEDITFDIEMLLHNETFSVLLVDPTPKAVTHYQGFKTSSDSHHLGAYSSAGKRDINEYTSTESIRSRIYLMERALSINSNGIFLFPPANANHSSYSIQKHARNLKGIAFESVSVIEILLQLQEIHQVKYHELFILKLDIEGSEYKVLMKLDFKVARPLQILVEIDFFRERNISYPRRILKLVVFLQRMKKNGYRLAQRESFNLLFLDDLKSDEKR